MTDRNQHGRFTTGNTLASKGGKARAKALSPQRRQEIAQLGWAGLVAKRFAGDKAAARAYLAQLGRWAYSHQAGGDNAPLTMRIRAETLFTHPGTPEAFLANFRESLNFTLTVVKELAF